MRLLWLADVLMLAGCKVVELHGWVTRGKTLGSVNGIVWHHTATGPNWTDTRVDNLLRDGRSDLAGPLSQLGLRRDGTFVVVASGRANHNGYGTWGNNSIGIEAYNSGTGEPWPRAQLDACDQGTAAILAHLKLGVSQVKGHRETDPGRKIDPAGIDMDAARQRVAHLLTYRPPPKDDDDMPTANEIAEALRPIVKEEVGKAIGWTRAVAENPEMADTDPQSKRLADRAAHLATSKRPS